MVNPLKHVNNLNANDLESIYLGLSKEYDSSTDSNEKKNLNQQILILILLCRRFPLQDLVKIRFDFFKSEPRNSILYRHLMEHSLNNFCKIDGILLTDCDNHTLTVEDVEDILASIDTGEVNKKLSVESLNITNSMLNDFGKMNFNKKNIRKYLDRKSSSIEVVDKDKLSNSLDDDFKLTDRIIDGISDRIISHLDESITSDDYEMDIQEVKEKQDILEDSLSNKHNQLTNKLSKIHQNIKSSNNKYKEFNNYFNEIALLKDSINTNLEKQDMKLAIIEEKFDEVLEKMDELNNTENSKYLMQGYLDKDEEMKSYNNHENVENNMMQTVTGENKYIEDKKFVYNWFNHNIKISNNVHNTISMEEIVSKISRDIENQNIQIDLFSLFNRMESYLSYWYKEHNPKVLFKDIKNTSIKGNEFYSYLKFININEERENRIKNIVVEWLKDNTCEVEGSKTYTQEIFDKIEPIFLDNGWIITTPEEWKELHDAGFSNAVPTRTFSQIIGKAVQDVYQSISKDTIQRDTPSDSGNVTWYPNIQILDKKISSNLESTIKDELSKDAFESDNIIYNWLKDNVIYTAMAEDKISLSSLFENLIKYLQVIEINISEKSFETVFNNMLRLFLENFQVELESKDEIIGFKLLNKSDNIGLIILKDWIENHIIITGNVEDKVFLEDINEKVLSAVYHEKINVINDTLYVQISPELRKSCITLSEFEESLKTILEEKFNDKKVSDNLEGIYYSGIKIIKYTSLNENHIREWINKNIEILLKANVASKDDIINNFDNYLLNHNIKNTTKYSIDELLDVAMREYYDNVNNVSLKLLNDSQNEYYVLVSV